MKLANNKIPQDVLIKEESSAIAVVVCKRCERKIGRLQTEPSEPNADMLRHLPPWAQAGTPELTEIFVWLSANVARSTTAKHMLVAVVRLRDCRRQETVYRFHAGMEFRSGRFWRVGVGGSG